MVLRQSIINYLVNYCVKNNIGTIVIGHNKLQKQNYNNGKKIINLVGKEHLEDYINQKMRY